MIHIKAQKERWKNEDNLKNMILFAKRKFLVSVFSFLSIINLSLLITNPVASFKNKKFHPLIPIHYIEHPWTLKSIFDGHKSKTKSTCDYHKTRSLEGNLNNLRFCYLHWSPKIPLLIVFRRETILWDIIRDRGKLSEVNYARGQGLDIHGRKIQFF